MQKHSVEIQTSALLTDSYQLSMMQAYVENGMTQNAIFELFVRQLPKNRNFLIAAGLEQAIQFLESVHFTPEEIEWMQGTKLYRPSFLEYLRYFRFTGDVDAIDEGTPFFAQEPMIRVSAPLPEAQLIESRLINLIHFQTAIASKAARTKLAAKDKLLFDFGFRRSHGAEAGLLAARATYMSGYSGTSTVKAGQLYQIPIFGTMAHSFIQAHASESLAFENFAKNHIGPLAFLLDTYDTEKAAQKVVQLLPTLRAQGIQIDGVRLDSGNLVAHSQQVRKILNNGGLNHVKILVSGNLEEKSIHKLIFTGAPIDGFGVGTRLSTLEDAPHLDCVYKLQEYADQPRRKRSEGKITLPGSKQVYRISSSNGTFLQDTITLVQNPQQGTPLLKPVMRSGIRLNSPLALETIQRYFLEQLKLLPKVLLESDSPAVEERYPIKVAECILDLAQKVDSASQS
jgi:nicotinate phosphoribosyltransferase